MHSHSSLLPVQCGWVGGGGQHKRRGHKHKSQDCSNTLFFLTFLIPLCLISCLPPILSLGLEVCHRVRCLLHLLLNINQLLYLSLQRSYKATLQWLMYKYEGLTRWSGDSSSQLFIAIMKYPRQATYEDDFVCLTQRFGGSRAWCLHGPSSV